VDKIWFYCGNTRKRTVFGVGAPHDSGQITGHRPSINVVSQALHMGPRTLQRRLQDSGPNFQRVLDEARHQMARCYLSNSALELNEAAYLLGFEAPTRSGGLSETGKASPWRLARNTSTGKVNINRINKLLIKAYQDEF
jgi:hypothetical protein